MPHATRDKTISKFSTTGLSPSMVQDSAASFKLCKDVLYMLLHVSCLKMYNTSLNNTSLNYSSPPTTPTLKIGLGCSRFARRYYGNRVCFLFLRLLRCFNSPGYLFPHYEFCRKYKWLPYSGIFGSKLASSSSKRIAGTRALHRLCVPRSPPFALSHLTLY